MVQVPPPARHLPPRNGTEESLLESVRKEVKQQLMKELVQRGSHTVHCPHRALLHSLARCPVDSVRHVRHRSRLSRRMSRRRRRASLRSSEKLREAQRSLPGRLRSSEKLREASRRLRGRGQALMGELGKGWEREPVRYGRGKEMDGSWEREMDGRWARKMDGRSRWARGMGTGEGDRWEMGGSGGTGEREVGGAGGLEMGGRTRCGREMG